MRVYHPTYIMARRSARVQEYHELSQQHLQMLQDANDKLQVAEAKLQVAEEQLMEEQNITKWMSEKLQAMEEELLQSRVNMMYMRRNQ